MPAREMLPLIPVFDAIFTEGNITRAAERLGVTQSAVSQSLARLRKLTHDDLFEPTGRGMRPTPRALAMARHLQKALAEVDAAVSPKEIDVATLQRTFVLDIAAGFDALVLPPLYAELVARAPRVQLLVSNTRGADLHTELKFGETELAFDFQASDVEHALGTAGDGPGCGCGAQRPPRFYRHGSRRLATLSWTTSPAFGTAPQPRVASRLSSTVWGLSNAWPSPCRHSWRSARW